MYWPRRVVIVSLVKIVFLAGGWHSCAGNRASEKRRQLQLPVFRQSPRRDSHAAYRLSGMHRHRLGQGTWEWLPDLDLKLGISCHLSSISLMSLSPRAPASVLHTQESANLSGTEWLGFARSWAGRLGSRPDVHLLEAAGRLEGTAAPGTARHTRDRRSATAKFCDDYHTIFFFWFGDCAGQDLLGFPFSASSQPRASAHVKFHKIAHHLTHPIDIKPSQQFFASSAVSLDVRLVRKQHSQGEEFLLDFHAGVLR